MNNAYDGASVLVTGGTGSFGRTVTSFLLGRGAAKIRILSRDEAKQHQMRNDFNDGRIEFHIGDVRDLRSVEQSMAGVDLVFHAAALKQVPSCEFFPMQAVMTNVFGSANVIDAALRARVQSVVCLSTDKAVMAVNAMGMTKALMEKVALASARAAESETCVSVVRYGNVLYSRGSVVPLFVEQIRAGKDLTVTNADMTRFLMPLVQAVDLVDFAFFKAEPGDTFIRKAPASTVGDLALAVNGMFGNPVGITSIGVRHGEKLYETLATAEELNSSQDLGDYYRLRMDSRNLDYATYFDEGDERVAVQEDYHSHNTNRLSVSDIQSLLLSLPEIQSELSDWDAR